MNAAALPLVSHSRSASWSSGARPDSPWVDFVWRGVAVLPDEPATQPWTVLREQDGTTLVLCRQCHGRSLSVRDCTLSRQSRLRRPEHLDRAVRLRRGLGPIRSLPSPRIPRKGEALTEAGANLGRSGRRCPRCCARWLNGSRPSTTSSASSSSASDGKPTPRRWRAVEHEGGQRMSEDRFLARWARRKRRQGERRGS